MVNSSDWGAQRPRRRRNRYGTREANETNDCDRVRCGENGRQLAQPVATVHYAIDIRTFYLFIKCNKYNNKHQLYYYNTTSNCALCTKQQFEILKESVEFEFKIFDFYYKYYYIGKPTVCNQTKSIPQVIK